MGTLRARIDLLDLVRHLHACRAPADDAAQEWSGQAKLVAAVLTDYAAEAQPALSRAHLRHEPEFWSAVAATMEQSGPLTRWLRQDTARAIGVVAKLAPKGDWERSNIIYLQIFFQGVMALAKAQTGYSDRRPADLRDWVEGALLEMLGGALDLRLPQTAADVERIRGLEPDMEGAFARVTPDNPRGVRMKVSGSRDKLTIPLATICAQVIAVKRPTYAKDVWSILKVFLQSDDVLSLLSKHEPARAANEAVGLLVGLSGARVKQLVAAHRKTG